MRNTARTPNDLKPSHVVPPSVAVVNFPAKWKPAPKTEIVFSMCPGDPVLVEQAPIISSAVQDLHTDFPPPIRYRVVNGGSVMYAGFRTIVSKDKVIDARSYNLDVLRAQGIVLLEV